MSERDVYDLSRVSTDPTNRDALRGELIDRARRANDLAHYPTASRDQERVQEHIDDLLRRSDSAQWSGSEVAHRILATGSEAYRRAFVKIIVSQIRMNSGPILTPEETQALKIVNEIRAMGQATGTVGGFAVPYTLDGTITATSAGSRNPFRQICRVETISWSNEWRQATSGAMTAAYAAEVAVASDNSPTLAQPTLRVVRAQAFAPVSLELAEDWGLINDQLGSLIQQAKDDLEATKFAVGTGTGEPEGVTVGGTAVSTTAAFDLASDLYPVELALPARFRPNAVWLANRAQYQLIRQFVQPESSAPIIDHVPGGPTEVIGYTAYEASGMTATATSGQKIMVLFDPGYYAIVDRIGLDIEVANHIFDSSTWFPKGQRGIYAIWRNYGKLLDATAARVLTVA
jgi:HK97 family phage major capsid protein